MKKILIFLGWIFLLLITACSPKYQGKSSFDEPNTFNTQTAETTESMLTQSTNMMDDSTQTPDLSLPPATPSPTASPTQSLISESYCNQVAFVKDVSIPDGTILSPGSSFVKTWRIKNKGTCRWTSTYSLIFISGHQMGGPVSAPLPGNVNPGETIDISVTLTTPATEGHYTGYWMLQNTSGVNFGYGDQATKAFFVDITSATPMTTSKPLLVWQDYSGSLCETAIFSVDDLALGECTGELVTIGSQNAGYLPRLLELVSHYEQFTAQTSAGSVTLNGTGQRVANSAEQRAIAEWARLLFQVVQAGRAGAAWGLVFTWHREGGIAGFCDDVTVYVTGLTSISNCTGFARQMYLNSSQLEQLYGWVDTLKNIDYSHTDPDITDPMTIRLAFSGVGNRQASQDEIQAISDFASSLVGSAPVSGVGSPSGGLAAQTAVKAVLLEMSLSSPLIGSIGLIPVWEFPKVMSFALKLSHLVSACNGLLYEFHTDFDGKNVRLAGALQPYSPTPPG